MNPTLFGFLRFFVPTTSFNSLIGNVQTKYLVSLLVKYFDYNKNHFPLQFISVTEQQETCEEMMQFG